MAGTYTIPDFGPADLLTSEVEGLRRVKVEPQNTDSSRLNTSSEPSIAQAVRNGMVYSITGSYNVAAGQALAMNLSLAAQSIIHKVTTNTGLQSYLYDSHATGVADGIFSTVNLNSCSIDNSPASAQLIYTAAPQGGIMAVGDSVISPFALADDVCNISAVTVNTTNAAKSVFLSILFEEIAARLPGFGLTPSTLLQPGTEMSIYG